MYYYLLTLSQKCAIINTESEGNSMKYFIITLPNGDKIFTKYHRWSEITRVLPYLNREQYDGILISEVNFWEYFKKLLTNY